MEQAALDRLADEHRLAAATAELEADKVGLVFRDLEAVLRKRVFDVLTERQRVFVLQIPCGCGGFGIEVAVCTSELTSLWLCRRGTVRCGARLHRTRVLPLEAPLL